MLYSLNIRIHIPDREYLFGNLIQPLGSPYIASLSWLPAFSCLRPHLLPSFRELPSIRPSPVSSGSPSKSSPTGRSVDLFTYALSVLRSYLSSRWLLLCPLNSHLPYPLHLNFWSMYPSSLCVKEVKGRRNRKSSQNHPYLASLLGSTPVVLSLQPSPSQQCLCHLSPYLSSSFLLELLRYSS